MKEPSSIGKNVGLFARADRHRKFNNSILGKLWNMAKGISRLCGAFEMRFPFISDALNLLLILGAIVTFWVITP